MWVDLLSAASLCVVNLLIGGVVSLLSDGLVVDVLDRHVGEAMLDCVYVEGAD